MEPDKPDKAGPSGPKKGPKKTPEKRPATPLPSQNEPKPPVAPKRKRKSSGGFAFPDYYYENDEFHADKNKQKNDDIKETGQSTGPVTRSSASKKVAFEKENQTTGDAILMQLANLLQLADDTVTGALTLP